MKMRAATCALAFACALAAAGENGGFVVLGHGNKPCKDVLNDYNRGDVLRLGNRVWVNGYLTAKNSRASVADITKGMDSGALERRILEHCSKHPDERLVDAAEALVRALQ